jgi:iron-sulfur cluster repair protein YtfE (RIC family)
VANDDPVLGLEHDHVSLSELTSDLRGRVAALVADPGRAAELHGELLEALGGLRDSLLEHFANEEEALFPMVLAHLPGFRGEVEQLQGAHDGLCGAVARMTYLAQRGPDSLPEVLPQLDSLFSRFDTAYASHAQEECSLLRRVGQALSPPLRRELSLALGGR